MFHRLDELTRLVSTLQKGLELWTTDTGAASLVCI